MMVRIAGYIRPKASSTIAGPANSTPCHFSPVRPLNRDARKRIRPKTAAKRAIAKNIRKNLPATLWARRSGSGILPATSTRTCDVMDSPPVEWRKREPGWGGGHPPHPGSGDLGSGQGQLFGHEFSM